MFDKIKNIIYDRKRSEDEYKIVIQVLERCKLRSCHSVPYKEIKDAGGERAYDYSDLKKLPDLIWSVRGENEALKLEIKSYKEQAENTSLVIDTILDTVEKRYDMKKGEGGH